MSPTITINLENGEKVEAHAAEWVAELILLLPRDMRAALCSRVAERLKQPVAGRTQGGVLLARPGRVRM